MSTELHLPPIITEMLAVTRNPKSDVNLRANVIGRMIDIVRVLKEEIAKYEKESTFRNFRKGNR